MKILDYRHLPCPQPVMRCRSVLAEQPRSLCILVDNEAAMENVRRFLSQRGFDVRVEKEGNEYRLTAHNGDESALNSGDPDAAGDVHEKILVLITTETLGRGDDTLGKGLMGTLLATLPEMGQSLWRVVLLNGGVKLAAEKGTALQSLQSIEASGVSVLVCGTCLAHYGLMECKAVGSTSNMLDIVTSLQVADKVIRP